MAGKGWRRARPDYPAGILAVYDSPREPDCRYTVVYTPETFTDAGGGHAETWVTFANIDDDGLGMHGECRLHERPRASGWGNRPGAGKVIAFEALPAEAQAYVRHDLAQWAQTCDDCGAQVPEIIGCPDGAEVCADCFAGH